MRKKIKYENYINTHYFRKYKYKFFPDWSLNYGNITSEYWTNNFLENYNGY